MTHANKVATLRRKVQEFAKAVDLKVKAEVQADGSIDLVLYDKRGEPLCTEADSYDMAESLGVYAGSHPNYAEAEREWKLYAE